MADLSLWYMIGLPSEFRPRQLVTHQAKSKPPAMYLTNSYFFFHSSRPVQLMGADLGFRWLRGHIYMPGEWAFWFHSHVAHSPGRSGHQDTPGSHICLDVLTCNLLWCCATDTCTQSVMVPRSTKRMSNSGVEPKVMVWTGTMFLEDNGCNFGRCCSRQNRKSKESNLLATGELKEFVPTFLKSEIYIEFQGFSWEETLENCKGKSKCVVISQIKFIQGFLHIPKLTPTFHTTQDFLQTSVFSSQGGYIFSRRPHITLHACDLLWDHSQ